MIKQKNFNRIIFLLLIFLALAVGYFQSALETEKRKYQALENNYLELKIKFEASESAQLIEDSY